MNAIHALSHLSYGPGSQIRSPLLGSGETHSAFFFLLDRLADDVGYVGVAFFLFLDEGGIVEALVAYLDFFLFARRSGGVGRSRLLALLLGLGVLERNEFGVCGLRHDAFGLRDGCRPCHRCRGTSGRARGGAGAAIGTTLPV